MKVHLYERLVATKHCLRRLYFHVPDAKELYLKCWKNNDWDEGDERDAEEFFDLEQKIYLEMFPYNKAMFEDKHEDDDINKVEIAEVTGKKPAARSKGKAVEEDSKQAAKSKAKKGGKVLLGLDFDDQI